MSIRLKAKDFLFDVKRVSYSLVSYFLKLVVHYPEILGRSHSKGIGKNVNRLLFSHGTKGIPNAGVRGIL